MFLRCEVILIVRFSFLLFLHQHQRQRHLPLALLDAIVDVCSITYGGGDFLHLRSRLRPEWQGRAPCPTRNLITSDRDSTQKGRGVPLVQPGTPSPQIETTPRRAGACPLSNQEPHHLRSRLRPEGQGRAPCPTRKLSTSGWLRLSEIECSAPANREAATSRPRTDRPMRRRVAKKGGLSRLSTKRGVDWTRVRERRCARGSSFREFGGSCVRHPWWERAFQSRQFRTWHPGPVSGRRRGPCRRSWLRVRVPSPQDREDHTRWTGPRQASIKTAFGPILLGVCMCVFVAPVS